MDTLNVGDRELKEGMWLKFDIKGSDSLCLYQLDSRDHAGFWTLKSWSQGFWIWRVAHEAFLMRLPNPTTHEVVEVQRPYKQPVQPQRDPVTILKEWFTRFHTKSRLVDLGGNVCVERYHESDGTWEEDQDQTDCVNIYHAGFEAGQKQISLFNNAVQSQAGRQFIAKRLMEPIRQEAEATVSSDTKVVKVPSVLMAEWQRLLRGSPDNKILHKFYVGSGGWLDTTGWNVGETYVMVPENGEDYAVNVYIKGYYRNRAANLEYFSAAITRIEAEEATNEN